MGVLLHENSSEGLSDSLDIFSVPPTQVSIEETQSVIFTPDHLGQVLEFKAPSNDGYYMDLHNSFLKLVVTIKKSATEDLAAGDNVAFVNNILDSLFKQVDVYFNSKLITSSDNNHGHKSYLYRLLNDTPTVSTNFMSVQGWCKDVAGSGNVAGAANTGFVTRRDWTAESADLELIGRIRQGMFEQPRYLIDGVDVRLKMNRNSDDFCIHRVAGKTGVVVIKKAEFHVRQVKIAESVLRAHKQVMMKTPAKYPYTRLEMSDHSFVAGTTSIQKDIVTGIMPTRIIFGFVNTAHYNGDATHSPYVFQNCAITTMSITVNGHLINGREFQFDFDEDNNLEAYLGLVDCLNKWDNETPFNITRSEYKSGYTLFGFDLSPDRCGYGCFQLEKSGSVHITINCKIPAGGSTLLVLKEYQSLLQIDNKGVVSQ